MDIVHEGSSAFLTVTFLDADGVAESPASATWEIVDVASGTVLLAPTAITPIDYSVELTLTPDYNSIVNDAFTYERHRLTVKATYGADDVINRVYEWDVLNLSAVT